MSMIPSNIPHHATVPPSWVANQPSASQGPLDQLPSAAPSRRTVVLGVIAGITSVVAVVVGLVALLS